MRLDLDNLPSDVAQLQQLVRDMANAVSSREGEINRLRHLIKQLQRMQFGKRSERLDPDQLALALEDLGADIGRVEESASAPSSTPDTQPKRRPLPDHLPREHVVIDVDGPACPCCGGTLHAIGESVSEMLDWVPAQLKVIRISRPKYACRSCQRIAQAPAPERPIAGGLAILRSPPALPAIEDLRPSWRRARPLHSCRLGGRRGLVAGSTASSSR